MDEEIKNLIEEYVRQIENNEADISSLKTGIDEIVYSAKKEMGSALAGLDEKFDAGSITEEEYMDMARKEKAVILEKTKEKLDTAVHGIM